MVTGHPPADAEHWKTIFQVLVPDSGLGLLVSDDLYCSPLVRIAVRNEQGDSWIELDQFQAQALGHVLLDHKRTLDAMRD
jgi:hypothetical protein